MKLKYILSIFILITLILPSFAQETIFDKTKEFSVKDKAVKSVPIRISIDKEQDNSFKIKLINQQDASKQKEFVLKPLQYDTFKRGFFRTFKQLTGKEIDANVEDLKTLYFDVFIGAMQDEKAPLAGTANFSDTVQVGWLVNFKVKKDNVERKVPIVFSIDKWREAEMIYFKDSIVDYKDALRTAVLSKPATVTKSRKKSKKKTETDKSIEVSSKRKICFIPSSTQIEFSNGYIQNIAFYGNIEGKDVVFENERPIGFSSNRDFKGLDKEFVVSNYKLGGKTYLLKVPISDFLTYQKNLRINTRDYCPENGVVSVQMPVESIKLYKEPTSNILEAKVFTDFNGLQDGNPNGIIQTEVEKRINLLTKRHDFFIKGVNYGWLQYVTPFAVLNKLEDKDKFLELKSSDPTTLTTNFLELLQYETFRTGVETNAFTFDVPFGKSSICIDGGIAFGKVTGTDTTGIATAQSNKYNINTLHLYGKTKFNVMPDERYGITFSYQLGHYDALNNEINYTAVEKDGSNKNWLQNIEMFAFWNIGDSGNLFFRYRLNSPLDNWKYNFSQVQVGYSFNITKQIKSK